MRYIAIYYGDDNYWDEFYHPVNDDVTEEDIEVFKNALMNQSVYHIDMFFDFEYVMERIQEYDSFRHLEKEVITKESILKVVKKRIIELKEAIDYFEKYMK